VVFQTGNPLTRRMGSDPAGSDPFRVCLFLLCAFLLTGASPTTNFTFGKKARPDPSKPERGQTPTAPEGVRPLEPLKGSDPNRVEPDPPPPVRVEPVETPAPAPVTPAPPAVHAEPAAPVGSDPNGGQTPSGLEVPVSPAPPPETVLVADEHTHSSALGLQSHAVDFPAPLAVPPHSMIVQQVWLDPQDPPRGIALQFKQADSEEAGVYWEGEEEVFNPAEHEELWYYGMLPELGKWVSLDILMEDLGLENSRITGLRFVTFDGRALWRKTVLTDAPPLEGSDQTSPAALPAPSISAPGSSS